MSRRRQLAKARLPHALLDMSSAEGMRKRKNEVASQSLEERHWSAVGFNPLSGGRLLW